MIISECNRNASHILMVDKKFKVTAIKKFSLWFKQMVRVFIIFGFQMVAFIRHTLSETISKNFQQPKARAIQYLQGRFLLNAEAVTLTFSVHASIDFLSGIASFRRKMKWAQKHCSYRFVVFFLFFLKKDTFKGKRSVCTNRRYTSH